MRTYVIETIEFVGVWFPMKDSVEVEATDIKDALEKVVSNYTEVYDDEVEDIADECKSEWGYSEDSDKGTFWGLVYNQILDRNECDRRIIKGYPKNSNNTEECFDLLD